MKFISYFFVLFSLIQLQLQAELRVADIFSSNMVLQCDLPIPVWGWAKPNVTVKVNFSTQTKIAKSDANGFWRCVLEAESASGAPRDFMVESETKILFTNVVVGEVWYASGQSNMEWGMKGCVKQIPLFRSYVKDYKNLRYREIKNKESLKAKFQIEDGKSWTVFSRLSVPEYSAVCFFTALELYKNLDVPIGIIEAAWGGHPIEPFIPESEFVGHPVLEQELKYAKSKNYEGLKTMIGGVYARNESWLPGTIYNTRTSPVAPYAIRGGLWYQAESNCGKGEDPRFYAEKMRALMRGWRKAWDNPKMPIYYVQLPQFDSSNWVRMREEQRMVMNDPHTGMVVLHDLFPFGIHPPNKLDVAKRLALWPLSKVYDKKIVCSGPQYSHIEIQDKQLVIHFKPTSSKLKMGLKADLHETLLLRKGELQGFEICDSQKSWFRAKAEIVGQTVVCSHEKVTHPIGVRYAWGKTMPSDFKWNLYNDAGLPASSFISDLKLAPFQLDGEP